MAAHSSTLRRNRRKMKQHGTRSRALVHEGHACTQHRSVCDFVKSTLRECFPAQRLIKTGRNLPKVPCGSAWTPTLRLVPPGDKASVSWKVSVPAARWPELGAHTRILLSNTLINSTAAALTSLPKTASTCACRFASSADMSSALAGTALVCTAG